MTLLFFYLFIALAVSFICSILEAVLLSSTNSYIETLPKDKAHTIKRLKSDIDKPIASILIINTFAHTMGAAGVGAQAQQLFGDEWQTLIAVILTLLILYISEIIPKTIGAIYWKALLIPSAVTIALMIKISYPLVWFSSFVTRFISKGKTQHANFSREEIIEIVSMGEKEGAILSKESYLFGNLLKLSHIKAKDVMTPRSVVFALPSHMTVEEAVEEDRLYIHSRIPVYEESIDHITGVVMNQTVLEESLEDHDTVRLSELAKTPHLVSENTPVAILIDLFIKKRSHLFIVHDSYGQTSGVITLEDVIETLLGVEIVDERDEVDDMQILAKDKSKFFQDRIRLDQKRRELLKA